MPEGSRRDFINWLLGIGVVGWFASIIFPLLEYVNPPKTPEAQVTAVKVGKTDEFPPNSGKVFKFGNAPAILIRTDTGDFRALSAVCTHLGCTVQYVSDTKIIWCACHNGRYDLNGNVISGPPPKPLQTYKVIVQKNEVYVTRA